MKTEFPRAYLAAVSHFMAVASMRYYLNGVFVEVMPGETRLVATNGGVAGAMRHPRENFETASVIIPRDIVQLAIKLPHEVLSLECDAGVWRLAEIPFTPIDGVYPAYRRVFPATCSGAAAHYKIELLARFNKAAKSLKIRSHPIVRQNGDDGALVHFYTYDNFVGVIMPLRMFNDTQPDLGVPSWI